jgi:hypothetical protein
VTYLYVLICFVRGGNINSIDLSLIFKHNCLKNKFYMPSKDKMKLHCKTYCYASCMFLIVKCYATDRQINVLE